MNIIIAIILIIGLLILSGLWEDGKIIEPRNLGEQNYNGGWRVQYNDGEWSQRFDYKTARDYADMFGGKVVKQEEMPKKPARRPNNA